MLHRVRIQGYKSLRDTEVRFDRHLSVIIGANAVGKSNLFDALALLSRMVTKRTLREAFEEHRGSILEAFAFGKDGIKGLRKKHSAEFSIEVDFDPSPDTFHLLDAVGEINSTLASGLTSAENGKALAKALTGERFRYSLAVRVNPRTGDLSVAREQLAIVKHTRDLESLDALLVRDSSGIQLKGRESAHIETINASSGSTAMSLVTLLQPFPSNLANLAAYVEMSRWRFYALEPHLMRQPSQLEVVLALGANGADIAAFFNTMKTSRPKQFESVRRALRLFIPQLGRFDVEVSPDGYLYLTVEENGIEYSSRTISEGTLRVLGLLAIAHPLEPLTLMGIEEPENGVHPRRLQLIATLFKNSAEEQRSQFLINTHSPLLPEYLAGEELIVCRRDENATIFVHVDTPYTAQEDIGSNGYDNEDMLATSVTDRIVRGDYGG